MIGPSPQIVVDVDIEPESRHSAKLVSCKAPALKDRLFPCHSQAIPKDSVLTTMRTEDAVASPEVLTFRDIITRANSQPAVKLPSTVPAALQLLEGFIQHHRGETQYSYINQAVNAQGQQRGELHKVVIATAQ